MSQSVCLEKKKLFTFKAYFTSQIAGLCACYNPCQNSFFTKKKQTCQKCQEIPNNNSLILTSYVFTPVLAPVLGSILSSTNIFSNNYPSLAESLALIIQGYTEHKKQAHLVGLLTALTGLFFLPCFFAKVLVFNKYSINIASKPWTQ